MVVAATFALRLAIGASTSWALDDFQARERLSAPLSAGQLFADHGGHLNPIGSLLQWFVQHALPGRYVPLMVISAALVGIGQLIIARWAARMYGYGAQPLVVAGFLGLSMMLYEVATWWSVAVYAAPMVTASSLLLLLTSQYLRTGTRFLAVLLVFVLCLLASPKAVLLPIVLVTVAAACPVLDSGPMGFRAAVVHWRRLWGALLTLASVYGVFYVVLSNGPSLGPRTLTTYATWTASILGQAVLPALWGGPWAWAGRFGIDPMPIEVPLLVFGLTAVFIAWSVVRKPASRRAWIGWGAYVACSIAMTAYGRAGSSLAGPALRYTFDLTLPSAVVLATILTDRTKVPFTPPRKWVALWAALWLVSSGTTYAYAWPKPLAITAWSAAVRAHYSEVRGGLLEQPMPSRLVLVPERLGTYLTGDPGAPEELDVVIDELLGFDDNGNLIDRNLSGVPVRPPGQFCEYLASRDRTAVMPLTLGVSAARHVIALDYSLNATSSAWLSLGDGPPTTAKIPAGVHRLYAVVGGQGMDLRVQLANPIATICVHSAMVGFVGGD
ncbi:MAG: hypothetical protein R2720_14310 [Candidatus Nanopelagicales bacterium]